MSVLDIWSSGIQSGKKGCYIHNSAVPVYTKKTNRTKTVKLLPSCPQHYMAVSGQPHTLVTLLPGDKSPGYPLNRMLDAPELVWIF